MIIGRLKLRPYRELDSPEEIERKVKELDEILDASFLAELAPSLERARLARQALDN